MSKEKVDDGSVAAAMQLLVIKLSRHSPGFFCKKWQSYTVLPVIFFPEMLQLQGNWCFGWQGRCLCTAGGKIAWQLLSAKNVSVSHGGVSVTPSTKKVAVVSHLCCRACTVARLHKHSYRSFKDAHT